jgi:hypothetical protein
MVLPIAMKRGLIGVLAVAVSLTSGASAASGGPVLQSVVALKRHVVVTVAVSDLAPGRVEVATRPATAPRGGFALANVKLRETIKAQPGTGGLVRWQTRAVLPRGTYYVVVSGFLTDGVTSCTPLPFKGNGNCLERWSNVRKVVVH